MQAFAPSMTAETERRKKPRNRPRTLVYVELESANGGMMRDLSEDGFALRAMMPLRAGEKTQFEFTLDDATSISGEGRILWIKESGHVAGIEFCGIPRKAREQIREWLGRTDQLSARESKVPATSFPEPSTLEELHEEARSTLARVALPSVEPPKAPPSPEPESVPAQIPVPRPTEHPLEEARFTLPRVALPSVEPPKATPSSEPQSVPAPIPVPHLAEQPPGEARFTLPRVALPSVESPKAAPFVEPEIAHVAISEPVGIAELAEARTGSATVPSPETQTEPHAILPATARATVVEPVPAKSVIEPLPKLQPKTEFSEMDDEHAVSRSVLMRAIGLMLLLTLIVSGVVFHLEVGHGFIWLGQVIAAQDGNTPPVSATLSIISNPDGADIEVDGVFLGSTPAELQLPVGRRIIVISKKGYKTYQRTIQVLTGSKQRVAVDLEANRQN